MGEALRIEDDNFVDPQLTEAKVDFEEEPTQHQLTLIQGERDADDEQAPERLADAEMFYSEDTVKQYLHDIGKTPLLTAEQEVTLAKRIEDGVFAKQALELDDQLRVAGDEPLLIDEEREEFKQIIADGAKARKDFIKSNLRLVVSIAKRYTGKDMEFLDIIQEGNLGLHRAVDKFDYHKGFKFSTYATWWIRQAIQRGRADRGRVVRIPVHLVEVLNKLTKTTAQLRQEYGREPTESETANEMNMTEKKVAELRIAAHEALSLDDPIGNDGNRMRIDTLDDDERNDLPPADEQAVNQLLPKYIEQLIKAAGLTGPEKDVVLLRFGLYPGEYGNDHTLQEIGARKDRTRERIRQLEQKALAKLRTAVAVNPDFTALRDYLK